MNRSQSTDLPATTSAYLVLQSAGRWSDVFRLTRPGEAIIGRSSASQIVLRSDQASRRHAKISWSDETGRWTIEDLGSRNKTYLRGVPIAGPTSLSENDVIEIAGFAITFTRRIDGGQGTVLAPGDVSSTDDQLTMELDPSSITDQRRQSIYLHSGAAKTNVATAVSHNLLQLAFALARCDEAATAVEMVLDAITTSVDVGTAGAYLGDSKAIADMPLVATRQTGKRSYRRPPESLIKSVASTGGQATLARNITGDAELATENSRGEIDVESLILAPVRDHAEALRGMIHLTTLPGSRPLGSDDLEFVVAACEILAESLANLSSRRKLSDSLRRSRRQVQSLKDRLGDKIQIVGRSQPILDVIEKISMAAPTGATVLIRGESGVGKELVAAALHHASDRRDAPMVCLNCAALSPTLLESELFGHEKGAFTGATERKQGKFEAADGGTLMLDEIGEMSAETQTKFLRVLEGHPFERVGGHQPIQVDVRVVAATNRDLQAMVKDGSFRQDLYYRLHVIEIVVPPLRQRGKDVLQLAEYFLQRFNLEMGRKVESITERAKKQLLAYAWPGNIRELKNVIERAVVLNKKDEIDIADLALLPVSHDASVATETSPELTLAELERTHIERVLRYTEGNKSRAATILGIERSTLDRKLKRFAAK